MCFWKSLESFPFFLGLEQVGRGVRICRTYDISQQTRRQQDLLDHGRRTCVQILALLCESHARTQREVCVLEAEGSSLPQTAPCHEWKGQSLLLE